MSIINLTGSSGEWESAPIGCILVLILLMIYKCFPKGRIAVILMEESGGL